MRRLIVFFLLLYGISCPTRLLGSVDTSAFLHFSLQNGFPTNNVYSLIQDKKGFLWFATDNGIVRYNGYDLELFNSEKGLPSNDIWELVPDNEDRVWFKSFSYELGFIKNSRYKKISYEPGERMILITQCAPLGDLFVFLENSGQHFNLGFANDDLIAKFPIEAKSNRFIGDARVLTASFSQGFNLNIWGANGKLYELDNGGRQAVNFLCDLPEILHNAFTTKIGQTIDEQIYCFKMYSNEVIFYDVPNCEYSKKKLSDFGGDPSEAIYALSPAHLPGNTSKYDYLITLSYMYKLARDHSLVDRQALSDVLPTKAQLAFRLEDGNGNTWMTTKGDGVWMTSIESSFFSMARKDGQNLDMGKYIGEIGDKLYWWNSSRHVLSILRSGKVEKEIRFEGEFDISSISGTDSLALASQSEGLFIFTPSTGKFVDIRTFYHPKGVFFGEQNADSAASIVALTQSRNVMIAGERIYTLTAAGLVEMTVVGDTLYERQVLSDRFVASFIDETGRYLYSYNSQKVSRYDVVDGEMILLQPPDLKEMGISNVRQVLIDEKGNLYLLDDQHLLVGNSDLSHFRNVSVGFSLFDSFLEIWDNKLFVAGRFGVGYSSIGPKGDLGDFHLIPNRQLNYYKRPTGFVVDKKGYAVLTSDEGNLGFHCDSILSNPSLTDASEKFFTLLLMQPFESRINNSDTFFFEQDVESIALGAINFYGSGEVRYIYTVSKEDPKESATGELFIGSLSPGNFYEVKCRLKDALWESPEQTFIIYRRPFWYQTSEWKIVFWVSGVLLFLGLILVTILITRFYVARMNERRRALTELELRAIHSQINPHFFFNTLSASLFFISKRRFEDAYDHVSKFSRLLRSYLKSSQDRYVILEEEINMLRNYIELQQIRFEEKFEFGIHVDNKLPLNNIKIPSLLLQPLVENAINHGLFHKEGIGGLLLVEFRQGKDSSEMVCIIEDNGIGRAAARKIQEENTARESYGTKLTNQLLDVFRQYEHLDITLEYTDKTGPETGTIVTLILKNIKYVA